jgi:hypothetical protein
VAFEDGELLAREVPDAGCVVVAAGNNRLSVGAECDGEDDATVPFEVGDLFAVSRIVDVATVAAVRVSASRVKRAFSRYPSADAGARTRSAFLVTTIRCPDTTTDGIGLSPRGSSRYSSKIRSGRLPS